MKGRGVLCKHTPRPQLACSAAESVQLREGVVIDEQARGNVERDDDVDGVVLMARQDEEHAEGVEHPGKGVQTL